MQNNQIDFNITFKNVPEYIVNSMKLLNMNPTEENLSVNYERFLHRDLLAELIAFHKTNSDEIIKKLNAALDKAVEEVYQSEIASKLN